MIQTYTSDASTPDSAGTATAFNCGKKTRLGTIGVDELVVKEECDTMTESNHCISALHHAMDQGMYRYIVPHPCTSPWTRVGIDI